MDIRKRQKKRELLLSYDCASSSDDVDSVGTFSPAWKFLAIIYAFFIVCNPYYSSLFYSVESFRPNNLSEFSDP